MRREGGEASVGRWGGLITDRHCALRISKFRCKLPSSKIRDAGTKMFDDIPRPTCRSVYTVSDKRLRHGGSGYETIGRWGGLITDRHCALRISKFRCKLPSSKIRDAGTKMFDDIPRPTCRSVYTVSDKRLRHGGSGYETSCGVCV